MKRIISILLVVLLMSVCIMPALAASGPTFSYTLQLTDSRGREINNLAALNAGDQVNVSINLTRTDIAEPEYQAYGIEFQLRTNGLAFNQDGETFREGTDVTTVQYFDGLVTGLAYLDLALQGETVANPLRVASWSYTVEDPAEVSLAVTTALVYVTGEDESSEPVQLVTLTLDPAGGSISGDVSGEYEEGSVVTLPTATRRGYTFDGWSDGSNVYSAGDELTLTHSMSLEAQWETNSGGGGGPSNPGGNQPSQPSEPDTPEEPEEPEEPDEPVFEMPFVDVPEDSYFYEAVVWAVKHGITDGTSDTTFSPYLGCTRAQMVTFLWRANGRPEPTLKTCVFEDVDLDSYYGKAVLWAIEEGITDGTSDTTFSPNMICSRAHMATFLYRMTEGEALGDDHPFVDVPDSEYYAVPVQWAFENKVTDGTSDTTYSPHDNCTRAQMVVFLFRLLAVE